MLSDTAWLRSLPRVLLEDYEEPFTDAHALAETFATRSGFYKLPVAAAAELTLGLKPSPTVEPVSLAKTVVSTSGEVARR